MKKLLATLAVAFFTCACAFGQVNQGGGAGGVQNPNQGGGGGNLPSSSLGQVLTNNNGGTGYAGQGQLYYAQAGDTVASIESGCSSLCTYVVTSPQTITLAANHALSSNVQLDFRSGGKWTVNGSFTLTIPGNVTGTLNQHFAGTSTIAFGPSQPYANVEWFGAVGDGTTVDYTAIQHALNALTAGQAVLQARTYSIGANTLSITKSSVGITGTTQAEIYPILFTNPPASVILETGASQDVIDVAGASTAASIFGNRFTNFTIERSQAPSGTAAGLSLSYTYAAVIDHVVSMDSISNFYIHASGSAGQGYIDNSVAMWGYNGITETTGALRGFLIDSSDGQQSPSLRMHNDNVASGLASTANTAGYVLNGSAMNDFMGWNLESAQTEFGAYLNGTGVTSIGAQDIHFINPVFDVCYNSCMAIVNATNAMTSSVDVDGGWMSKAGGTAAPIITITGSNNVVIRGVQIYGLPTYGIQVQTSSNLAFVNNNFHLGAGSGVWLIGGSDYTVDGNLITAPTLGVQFTSSASHASISNNVFSGMTTAVSVAAGSSNISGLETNSYDASVTTPVSSAVPFLIPPIGSETVTFSATPTFSNITRSSYMALTGNVTSFTLPAGLDGQAKTMIFCQDATGGRTVTAPANVAGFVPITATASVCSGEHFTYSGALSKWQNDTLNAGGSGTGATVTDYSAGTAVTLTPGTNVTSVTCTSSVCTTARGSLSVVGGTATTGTIATIGFNDAPTSTIVCDVHQNFNGSATNYFIGHGDPTTASVTVTSGSSVSSATVKVDYSCSE